MTTIQEEKTTSDLYLCAAFLALGAEISKINKDNPKRIEFTVVKVYLYTETHIPVESSSSVDELESVVRAKSLDEYEIEWANGTLLVNAVKYKDAIQRLKGIVHSR